MQYAGTLTLHGHPTGTSAIITHKLPHLIVSVDFGCGDLPGEEEEEIPEFAKCDRVGLG